MPVLNATSPIIQAYTGLNTMTNYLDLLAVAVTFFILMTVVLLAMNTRITRAIQKALKHLKDTSKFALEGGLLCLFMAGIAYVVYKALQYKAAAGHALLYIVYAFIIYVVLTLIGMISHTIRKRMTATWHKAKKNEAAHGG